MRGQDTPSARSLRTGRDLKKLKDCLKGTRPRTATHCHYGINSLIGDKKMNKGLKGAGWLLIVVALVQSAADLRTDAPREVSAQAYAAAEIVTL